MPKLTLVYKPNPNGPLAPRVRQRQIMLSKVDIIIEDRDATTDLSREPDLSGFPDWTWTIFGANVAPLESSVEDDDPDLENPVTYDKNLTEDDQQELDDLNRMHRADGSNLDDLFELRRLDVQRWVEETYGEHPDFWPTMTVEEIEQERQDARQDAAHMRDIVYGHPFEAYGMTIMPDQDWGNDHDDHVAQDDASVGTESAINEAEVQDAASDSADVPSEEEIAVEQVLSEQHLDMSPVSQFGGLRGQRATKSVSRNLCRPHHFLAIAS
jgi:hypothetical protein